MYGTPQPRMPWPSYTVSTCFWRSTAIEMARRTRRSLKGGLSCASANPNGVSVLWYDCTTAAGLVLRMVSTSEGLASEMKSLCPVRNAATRVAVPGEDHALLPRVLLEDVRPGADHALLEITILLEDLARKDDRDGLGDVLREQHVGRVEVHAQRVLVRRLHPLDLAKVERLDALFRVGLEAVFDVPRHQLAPVQRWDVVPLDALAQLERPDPVVRARLPGFREIALEREVAGAGRLVGERVADQAAAREAGELEEPDRLCKSWIDHRRIPLRGASEHTPAFRRLGARGDPVGIGRRRLSRRAPPTRADRQRGHPGAGPSRAFQEIASRHVSTGGPARVRSGHRSSPSLS